MMRIRLFLFLLCLLPVATFAQSEKEIIDMIGKASSDMKTLECDFVQIKHLKILNDEMVSKGKMYYSQPDMLRWEYVSPYSYVFVLNDSKVLISNDGRTDIIDVNQNKVFKEIARLMMDSIVGNSLSDNTSFDISIDDTTKEWVATLLPLKKDMKQMWNRLVLHFDKGRRSVVKVEMHEKSGDYTEINLSNIVVNSSVDKSVFDIR